jgi:hypothetical protein
LTRAVSILEVERPAVWDELDAITPVTERLGERLSDTRAVVDPAFEREVLPALAERGAPVLIRYARQPPVSPEVQSALAAAVAELRREVRDLLHHAQRHAVDQVVVGSRAWDPEGDARLVDALHGAGLIALVSSAEPPRSGRYRLAEALPAPPELALDVDDALMDPTDDLDEPPHGPVALLQDVASLAAAMVHHPARRTLAGTLERHTGRALGKRLASPAIAASGRLEDDPRWARALRGLELLGALSMDPVSRALDLDPHLESMLAGDVPDAADRLVHRLVEPDLHPVLPVLRTALAAAGDHALDEVVLLELLAEQHRELLFRPWHREVGDVYPLAEDQPVVPFGEAGWEHIEARLIRGVLRTLHRLGLIRRAPGVIAATADGRLWAGAPRHAPPPLWISSDLEVIVPPEAVTPWERFQIERLGRCLARDVVDRYKLERRGVTTWLATHDLEDALALLARRCPAVPSTVVEALSSWAQSALRVVLTRGVLLDDPLEVADASASSGA